MKNSTLKNPFDASAVIQNPRSVKADSFGSHSKFNLYLFFVVEEALLLDEL